MIKKIASPVLALLVLLGALGTLAGCNTVQGAGEDIRQGGQAISNEARDVRDRR